MIRDFDIKLTVDDVWTPKISSIYGGNSIKPEHVQLIFFKYRNKTIPLT